MAGKFKITGFARFFIFLLVAAPLIYSGVSMFRGENPLESAKRDLGIESSTSSNKTSISSSSKSSEIAELKSELNNLKDENRALKRKLEDCQ